MDQNVRVDSDSNRGRNSSRLDMIRTVVQDFYQKSMQGHIPFPNPITTAIDDAVQNGIATVNPQTHAISITNDPAKQAARNAFGAQLVGIIGRLDRTAAPMELQKFRMTQNSTYRALLGQLPCAYAPASNDMFFLSPADRAESLSRLERLIVATTLTNPNQQYASKALRDMGAELVGSNFVLPRFDQVEKANALIAQASTINQKSAQSFRDLAFQKDNSGQQIYRDHVLRFIPLPQRDNTIREDVQEFLRYATPAQINGVKSNIPEAARRELIDPEFVEQLRALRPEQMQALDGHIPGVEGIPTPADLAMFLDTADGIAVDNLRKYLPAIGFARPDQTAVAWLNRATDEQLEPLRATTRTSVAERVTRVNDPRVAALVGEEIRDAISITVSEGVIPHNTRAVTYEEAVEAFLASASRADLDRIKNKTLESFENKERNAIPRTAERFWSGDQRLEQLAARGNKPFTADDKLHLQSLAEVGAENTIFDLDEGPLNDAIKVMLDQASFEAGEHGVDLMRDKIDLYRDLHEATREMGLSPGREMELRPGDTFEGRAALTSRHHVLVRGTITNAGPARSSEGYAILPLGKIATNNLRDGTLHGGIPRKGDIELISSEAIPLTVNVGSDGRYGLRVDPQELMNLRERSQERRRQQDREDYRSFTNLDAHRDARRASRFRDDELMTEAIALSKAAEVYKVENPRMLAADDLAAQETHSGPVLAVGRTVWYQMLGKRNIVKHPMLAFAREPRVDREAEVTYNADFSRADVQERELVNDRVKSRLDDFAKRLRPALNADQNLAEEHYCTTAALTALAAEGFNPSNVIVGDMSDEETIERMREHQPLDVVLNDRLYEPHALAGMKQKVDPRAKDAWQQAQAQNPGPPLPANARQRAVTLTGAVFSGIVQAASANKIAFATLVGETPFVFTTDRPEHPDLDHPITVGDEVRFNVTKNGIAFDPPESLLRSGAYERFSQTQEIMREQAFIEAGYHVLAQRLGVERANLVPMQFTPNEPEIAALGLVTNHAAYFTQILGVDKYAVATLPSRVPERQEAESLALVGMSDGETNTRSAIRNVNDDLRVSSPGMLFSQGWKDSWHVDPRGTAVSVEPSVIRDARNAHGAILKMGSDQSIIVDAKAYAEQMTLQGHAQKAPLPVLNQGFANVNRDVHGNLVNDKFTSRGLGANSDLMYLAYPNNMGDIIELHRDNQEMRLHPKVDFNLDQPLKVTISQGQMLIEVDRTRSHGQTQEKQRSIHDQRTMEQNLRYDDREILNRDSLDIAELTEANQYGLQTQPRSEVEAEIAEARAMREHNAQAAKGVSSGQEETADIIFDDVLPDLDQLEAADFGISNENEINLEQEFDNRGIGDSRNDGARNGDGGR